MSLIVFDEMAVHAQQQRITALEAENARLRELLAEAHAAIMGQHKPGLPSRIKAALKD